jgi:glycerophosphoryl diester phosphodiesterase
VLATLLGLAVLLPATASATVRGDHSPSSARAEGVASSFPVTRVVTARRVLHPTVIGHRGEPAAAPEQTLPSFQAAIDHRADVLEFDVQWTRDGAMVALHDSTLDRTTDCTGTVQTKTLAEVQGCDAGSWRGAEWVGTRVPTMQEVVALAREHNLRIAPEIKQDPVTRTELVAFAQVISDAGMAARTVVQSFSRTSLELYRSLGTGVALGYITLRSTRDVATVKGTGASVYIVDTASITRAQVRAFQAARIKVWLYTVTDAANNRAALSRYPNGVITNDVVLTRSALP